MKPSEGAWRWYLETGNGYTADWGEHMFDIAQAAIGTPCEIIPKRIYRLLTQTHELRVQKTVSLITSAPQPPKGGVVWVMKRTLAGDRETCCLFFIDMNKYKSSLLDRKYSENLFF